MRGCLLVLIHAPNAVAHMFLTGESERMRKAFLMGIAGLVLSVQTARAATTTTEQQWLTKLHQVERSAGADKQSYGEMLFAVGSFYHKQRNYTREAPMFNAAMKIFEKQPGKNSDLLRYYSDQLARVYAEEGKHEQAESMYKRALTLGEAIPGRDKTYVVPQTLGGLSELYIAEGRFDEAENATKKRIEMRHRFMNAGQVDPAYVDLANLYTKWGKLDQAKNVIDLLLTMQTPPPEVKTAIATYAAAAASAKSTN
jgi:tetratricopeptide (TPR) repeat protein